MRQPVIVVLAVVTLVAFIGCGAHLTEPVTTHPATTSAVDGDTARRHLAKLVVADPVPTPPELRSYFPHWIRIEGACDTREVVLRDQGDTVRVGPDCAPTEGYWVSPYDGVTWTDPSDLDVDHLVSLAEAWRSGAHGWTTQQRRDFANDLTNPQLHAVTDNVNQAKGDRPPQHWKPPLRTYWCTYAGNWITIKHTWTLTVTPPEMDALHDMLNTC